MYADAAENTAVKLIAHTVNTSVRCEGYSLFSVQYLTKKSVERLD